MSLDFVYKNKIKNKKNNPHLDSFPAPFTILGILCDAPEVEISFNDLRPKDVVLLNVARPHCLGRSIEAENFRTQFHSCTRSPQM